MENSSESSATGSAQTAASARSESFPFLAERVGPRQGEVPRQAALERWRTPG